MDEIKLVDLAKIDLSTYQKQLADCVILTHDNKIYMQKRPDHWHRFPGVVCNFGGHIEENETPIQAVIRELNEETGARINPKDLLFVGAITEAQTNHTEIIHVYFWHDKNHTITGCYEAEPFYFNTLKEALAYPKMMEYAKWALEKCRDRGLLE